MNAIVSLCHFCEIHGATVLFCTQEILRPKLNNELEDQLLLSMYLTPSGDFEAVKNIENTSTVPLSNCKSIESCDACQSFSKVAPGFTSRDKSKLYLSTQHPYEKNTYETVRQTCVQSISCEQCPGQVGPMFFGDEGDSYTFSFKFSLKDFHSRGFKRNFSINIISKDKVYLLNSWDFLSKNLEGVINVLKSEAVAVFDVEHARHGSSLGGKSLPNMSSSISTFHRKNIRQQKSQNKQTRSLCDITGNSNVFEVLHRSFVLLLKLNSERLVENVVKKTQHNFIDLNKSEETEEGFVKLFSEQMKYPLEENVACQYKDKSIAVFTHLRSLMKVLGLSTFTEVLYHVLIGTQLLVRAQDKEVIRSVIDCFKVLLPDGCRNITYHTIDYKGSMHSNFIGMPLLPLLPADLKPCLLLDISGIHTLKKIPRVDKSRIYDSLRPEIEELLLRYYMATFEKIHLPMKIPSLLESIQKIILNDCLDNSVVDLCVASLREDWFNKARAYYAFTKTGQRSKNDVEKLLQVLGARNEDKIILTFWMTALFPKDNLSEQ